MSIKTKFGSATIDNKGYYKISSSKEGNRGKLLHRLVFEDFYQIKLPKSIAIHHNDGDKLNNEIWNLVPMTRAEHMSLHRKGKECWNKGKSWSVEVKEKIRQSHLGKTHSEETKQKMSESRKGENNAFYGKHHSKETITKIIEKQKGEKSCMWKPYARIIKSGWDNGNQVYGVVFKGKKLKTSYYKEKLINWFLENYPLEIMRVN